MCTWKTLPSFAHPDGTDMWKFGSWPMDYDWVQANWSMPCHDVIVLVAFLSWVYLLSLQPSGGWISSGWRGQRWDQHQPVLTQIVIPWCGCAGGVPVLGLSLITAAIRGLDLLRMERTEMGSTPTSAYPDSDTMMWLCWWGSCPGFISYHCSHQRAGSPQAGEDGDGINTNRYLPR